jgi:hypothetical protein
MPLALTNKRLITLPDGPRRIPWVGLPLRMVEDHPLRRFMIGCWVPGLMGGQNLCTSPVGGYLQTDTAAAFFPTIEGRGLKSTAANSGMYANARPLFYNWPVGFSVAWRGTVIGAPINGNAAYGGIHYDNTGNSPYVVAGLYNEGNGGSATVRTFWNAAGSFSIGTQFTLAAGIHTLGASFNITLNNITYIDGASVSADLWGAGAPNAGSQPLIELGTDASTLSRALNGLTNIMCMWNVPIQASAHGAFHLAPYELIEPDVSMVGWGPKAAAAVPWIPVNKIQRNWLTRRGLG